MARSAPSPVIELTLVSASRAFRGRISAGLERDGDMRIVHLVSSLRVLDLEVPRNQLYLIHLNTPSPGVPLPREFAEKGTPVLFLSDDIRAIHPLSESCSAAWGWAPPWCSIETLKAAIRSVHAGFVSVHLSAYVSDEADSLYSSRLPESEDARFHRLSPREQQVLELLSDGCRNSEIARRLDISENTVKFHLSELYSRLGVSGRAEAVREGIRYGLLSV